MKLYTIHSAFDNSTTYAGTQADARAKRIELEAPHKALKPKDRPAVTVGEVDVPTDKAGLLAYLNKLVAQA